jgi:hypothetical protein
VPAENSAAAVIPAEVEPMAVESERVQPEVSVAGLVDVELSEPVPQATAAAPAAEAVITVRLVSEALSALVLMLEVGVPASVPAAVEPAAAAVAVSAAEPGTVEGERPVLASGSLEGVLGVEPCSRTQSDAEKDLGRADGNGGGV